MSDNLKIGTKTDVMIRPIEWTSVQRPALLCGLLKICGLTTEAIASRLLIKVRDVDVFLRQFEAHTATSIDRQFHEIHASAVQADLISDQSGLWRLTTKAHGLIGRIG